MRLTHRLALGTLVLVGTVVGGVVLTADRRLSARLYAARADELGREASLVAAQWTARADPAALAETAGRALGHRVTLIDGTGRVVGDARFTGAALARLENHAARPEVVQARARGQGVARRLSASAGDEELYVAVRAPLGFARVSTSTTSLEEIIDDAQWDVLAAGLVALVVAAVLTYAFSHSVSRPIVALRDAARAIAAGEHAPPPTIRPAIDASGEVGDLAGAVFRMADQLTSRLAHVQEDEALLAALVESLAEGIVAADVHGQVVRMNASARTMLGIDDPVPVPLARIADPVVQDALRGALAGTVITQREMRTAGDRVLTLTATPLASAGGAVLTLMDLTQVRRLEAVRRDFVANVSHELKTPLTVVGGFAETLTDDELPAAQRRQFAVAIQANARRMQRIVDDLLDLSRIESGGWVPAPAAVELRAAAAEALAAAAATAAAKGIGLEVAPGPGAAAVHADPTALRQVLSNLVENAVRHTSAGGVVVATRRNAGYPAGVWLEVRDTGSGIAPKHLPRIFQRFYRPDPGRSRAEGGTGLGLAIVKHLVEAHGGVVRAASAVGQGTTMSAFFPDAPPGPNGSAA